MSTLKLIAILGLICICICHEDNKSVMDKARDAKEELIEKGKNAKEDYDRIIREVESQIGGWKDMATDKLVEMKEKGMHYINNSEYVKQDQQNQGIKDVIAQKAASLKDWIGSVVDNIIPHSETQKKAESKTYMEELRDLANKDIEELKRLGIKEAVFDKIDAILHELNQSELAKKGKDLKEDAAERLSDIKDTAFDAKDAARNEAKSTYRKVKEAINEKIESIEDKVEDIKDSVVNKAKNIKENISDKVSDAGEYVQNKAIGAKEAVSNKVEDVKSSISSAYQGAKETAQEKIENAKETIKNIKETIIPPPKPETTMESIKRVANEKLENAEEALKSGKEAIIEKASEFKERASRLVEDTKDTVGSVKEGAREKYEHFKDTIGDTKEGVKQKYEHAKDYVKEKIETGEEKLAETKDTVMYRLALAFEYIIENFPLLNDSQRRKLDELIHKVLD